MGLEGSNQAVLVVEIGRLAGSEMLMLEQVEEEELEQSEGPLSEEPRRTDLGELLAHKGDVEDHCDEAAGHSECSASHQLGLVEVGEVHSIVMTANCSMIDWNRVRTKSSTLLQSCASACLNLYT